MSEAEDRGLVNLRWAFALVDGLAAAGVSQVVISPGSRSTPLVLACDRHPNITTRVHLDERGAAFLALGLAQGGGAPVAVVATSGSAPTHWYPAVVEAAQTGVPLVFLSADRPPELQDWGANQTLDQQRLFGVHGRAFHQAGLPEGDPAALAGIRLLGVKAVAQARWPRPGPVQINLPFREPLVPKASEPDWPRQPGPPMPLALPRLEWAPDQLNALARELGEGPGLIVCGPGLEPERLAPPLTALARRLGAPILADPLSDLRFGPWDREWLLTRHDAWLRGPRAASLPEPAWLLRLGRAPVSKALLTYLQGRPGRHLLVAPGGDWPDPLHRASGLLRTDPASLCQGLLARLKNQPPAQSPEDWAAPFRALEAAATPDLSQERQADRPFEGLVVADLLNALPDGATLFSGNSLPIRQLDTWSGSGPRRLRLRCNRGLSGIDGNVGTLLGLAAAGPGPVVGLLGDLALLHDLNSLLAAPGLNAVLIVLNNGGGGIFGHLPQAGLAGFQRYWLTPQGIDLAQVARLFRLGYQRVERQSAFPPALAEALASPGVHLVEILIDRAYSLARHRAYWSSVDPCR